MWKGVLIVLLLSVAGHFAVRYLRTNPLDPVLEGGELVVETNEHEVRFALEGAVEGTYLVARAESQDFGDAPANAALSVLGLAATRDYFQAHPDQREYGSVPGLQLENLSAPLALIAANRPAYAALRGLVDEYEERVDGGGKWLCLTIAGQMLRVTSAESLGNGNDATALFAKRAESARLFLANRVLVEDCAELVNSR